MLNSLAPHLIGTLGSTWNGTDMRTKNRIVEILLNKDTIIWATQIDLSNFNLSRSNKRILNDILNSQNGRKNFKQVKNFIANNNREIIKDFSSLITLENLTLRNNGFIDMNDLRFPPSLKKLDLSNNSIRSFKNNFNTYVPLLTNLDMSVNNLSDHPRQIILGNRPVTIPAFNFAELPQTLKELNLSSNRFYGLSNFTNLPNNLEILMVDDNIFNDVNVSVLPNNLRMLSLNIRQNNTQIIPNFTQLPTGLEILQMNNCYFSGSPDLTQLPRLLQKFESFNNQYTGNLDLSRLPDLIQSVDLSLNQFVGNLDLSTIPASLHP